MRRAASLAHDDATLHDARRRGIVAAAPGPCTDRREAIGYSLTVFFHFIPAITETSTRLPAGAPLLASADAPELKMAPAALFAMFLVGAALQAWWLHGRATDAVPVPPVPAT